MDAFCVKGVVNFDFLFDTMPPKLMFFVTCSTWHPFLVKTKYVPQRMPFRTNVLNVSLQNTPDMVSLMTEVVNVKPFFG